MDWAETTARRDEKYLSVRIWCVSYYRFNGIHRVPLCFVSIGLYHQFPMGLCDYPFASGCFTGTGTNIRPFRCHLHRASEVTLTDMGKIGWCLTTTKHSTICISCLMIEILTHLTPGQNGRHFADDIFKCIFVNKTFPKFHWSLFLTFQLTIASISLENVLVPIRRQAIMWNNADPICWRIYAALEGRGLIWRLWDEVVPQRL